MFLGKIYKNTQLMKDKNSKNVILHPQNVPKM